MRLRALVYIYIYIYASSGKADDIDNRDGFLATKDRNAVGVHLSQAVEEVSNASPTTVWYATVVVFGE